MEGENKTENGIFRKKRKDIKDYDFLNSLLSGGTAGVISKTVIAPVERVKLIYQVKN